MRFEVDAPAEIEAVDCNCSMCRRSGYLHLIVEADRFRLLAGDDVLTDYRFNTGTARHLFCSVCGDQVVLRSALAPGRLERERALSRRRHGRRTSSCVPFDGAHWEESIDGLRGEA